MQPPCMDPIVLFGVVWLAEQRMRNNDEWAGYVAWHEMKLAADPWLWFRAVVFVERAYNFSFLLRLLNQFCEGQMARGKKNATPTQARNQGAWTQFVDISLAGHEWADINRAYGSADAIEGGLAVLLEHGYRVSFAYNSGTDAVICSVTCRAEDDPNVGKTFNAFAGSWLAALQCALYKHHVVAHGNWTEFGKDVSRPAFG